MSLSAYISLLGVCWTLALRPNSVVDNVLQVHGMQALLEEALVLLHTLQYPVTAGCRELREVVEGHEALGGTRTSLPTKPEGGVPTREPAFLVIVTSDKP